MMADKYAVREYIKEKIGEEYLIPLLGVWDKAEDIEHNSRYHGDEGKSTEENPEIADCRKPESNAKGKADTKANRKTCQKRSYEGFEPQFGYLVWKKVVVHSIILAGQSPNFVCAKVRLFVVMEGGRPPSVCFFRVILLGVDYASDSSSG